jgi:hypothetical protein
LAFRDGSGTGSRTFESQVGTESKNYKVWFGSNINTGTVHPDPQQWLEPANEFEKENLSFQQRYK